ncbi:YlxR family protein [Nesterenkonia pannonica]|uniref:YlxR family protein n=1 Tax=Nesterenkonia pannonica TaxID=1548602 RepID=UPI00216498A7|nr:YlxR family protein [Nesterenkonia pannonica]
MRPDPARRMPGRGAWLHLSRECFDSALKRRAFSRAFRAAASTEGLEYDAVAAHVSTDKRTGLKE